MFATTATMKIQDATDAVDGSERRRGLRIRQTRPVKVYEPAGARYFGGQTEDVSSTGLRLELPLYANVQPGEMLSVHVGLSTKGETLANRRQMLPARVVWVNRMGGQNKGRMEAGVEFIANMAAGLDAA
jgi:hypothetical protein